MKTEKKIAIKDFKNLIVDGYKLAVRYITLFYYFLKKLFSYDFFIKSITVKCSSKVSENSFDTNNNTNTRIILKQKNLNTFYKYFVFPHITYLRFRKQRKVTKRRQRIFNYKNSYLRRLIGTKRATAKFNNVNLATLKNVSKTQHFNVTNSKHYYYINRTDLFRNYELLNPYELPDINTAMRARIMKVLKYKAINTIKAIPSLTRFANLNLVSNDYYFTLNSVELDTTYNNVQYNLQKKFISRVFKRCLIKLDIIFKILNFKIFNMIKLTLLRFPLTQNYFFLKKKIPVITSDQNIYYDLLFDRQYNFVKKPLPVLKPFQFYDDEKIKLTDFYFFKKLRLLDVYFYLDFNELNYEQRFKLFSNYVNHYSTYDNLLKNFKFYKTVRDKDLIIRFNRVTKNLPYMKEFLAFELPFNREYDAAFYKFLNVRLIDDGATFLTLDHFLKQHYFNSFSKIKKTYFSSLKSIYKNYKSSKINYTYLPLSSRKHLFPLKAHFDKLYNLNSVKHKNTKLYLRNIGTPIYPSFESPYYVFDFLPKPAESIKQSFLTSKVFGVNFSYYSNDEETKESLLRSVIRSNTDHLEIPLYFTQSFMLNDNEPFERLNNQDLQLKKFLSEFKSIGLEKFYQKLNFSNQDQIKQLNLKKTILFNNKTELPDFVNDFFIFDFLTYKINVVEKKKNFSTKNIFILFFFTTIFYFTISLIRILINYKSKAKVEKIFLNVYNTYSTFLLILLFIFFFLYFFSTLNDFFIVSNYILLYINFVTSVYTTEKVQLDLPTPEQDKKLNFSTLRYQVLKNFYHKHFVDKERNNNFLFNEKGRNLSRNLFGLSFFKNINNVDTSVTFEETNYKKRFFTPDLTSSILFILSISWFDFYFLNFVIFLSLFFFKMKLTTSTIKNKILYLTTVMLFEITLITFFYLYYSNFLIFGFKISSVYTFFLIILFLLSYVISKIK